MKNDEAKKEILADLGKIYNSYKEYNNFDRLYNYINFFVETFKYDDKYFESEMEAIKNGTSKPRDQQAIQEQLLGLFKNGKGVCEQFAQALTILSQIDVLNTLTKTTLNEETGAQEVDRGFLVSCIECKIVKNGKLIAHEINGINLGKGKYFIIDISSMIHAKYGDYKQDKESFCFKSFEDYVANMKMENIDVVSVESGKNYAVVFDDAPVKDSDYIEKDDKLYKPKTKIDAGNYLDYITQPADVLMAEYQYSLKQIDIPKVESLEKGDIKQGNNDIIKDK